MATQNRRRASAAAWIAPLVLLLLWVVLDRIWGLPIWIAVWYLVASALCFFLYLVDKSAAKAGRDRIPESALHLVELSGGWPGAVAGQQLLRHKSIKVSYQRRFWALVVLNMLVFVAASALLFGRVLHDVGIAQINR